MYSSMHSWTKSELAPLYLLCLSASVSNVLRTQPQSSPAQDCLSLPVFWDARGSSGSCLQHNCSPLSGSAVLEVTAHWYGRPSPICSPLQVGFLFQSQSSTCAGPPPVPPSSWTGSHSGAVHDPLAQRGSCRASCCRMTVGYHPETQAFPSTTRKRSHIWLLCRYLENLELQKSTLWNQA